RALVAWALGLAAFVLATAVASSDLFLRVEIGSIAGAAVGAGVVAGQYFARLRAGISDASLAALVEQIEHEPLEVCTGYFSWRLPCALPPSGRGCAAASGAGYRAIASRRCGPSDGEMLG